MVEIFHDEDFFSPKEWSAFFGMFACQACRVKYF